jgi:3-deoxy-7-phosphoheptulonate synthase
MISPEKLIKKYPNINIKKINLYHREIANILNKKDKRLVVFLGPCSIHNIPEAIEYAKKVKEISDKVSKKILLVMRTYFEKPRTTAGWKGFIYDPNLDESFDLKKGVSEVRRLLVELSSIGVPCVSEFLNPNLAVYFEDLICCGAIGARTSESQIHREFVSDLDFPVGFKNNLDGNIFLAVNSIVASSKETLCIRTNLDGKISPRKTKGNKNCFLILRGGRETNYSKKDIEYAEKELQNNMIKTGVVVDCSHGNSKKYFRNQGKVFLEVLQNKEKIVCGLMLESYFNEGNQEITKKLKYGVSVTDSCIGWEETERLVEKAYNFLS